MKKSRRRIIFYFLILTFFAAAPFIILYAVGYTVNFQSGSFSPTGGFFVKTNVTGFKVFVNGSFVKETNFLAKGALVNGLVPETVSVEIQKEGYLTWRKTFKIEEQTVQEFRYAFLAPLNLVPEKYGAIAPKETAAAKAVFVNREGSEAFLISRGRDGADRLTVISLQATGAPREIDLPKRFKFDEASLDRTSSALLIRGKIKEVPAWYILGSAGGTIQLEPLFSAKTIGVPGDRKQPTLAPDRIESAAWAENGDSFFLLAGQVLYRWNRGVNQAEVMAENVASFGAAGSKIVFTNQAGFVSEVNANDTQITILGRPGFFTAENEPLRYVFGPDGAVAIIDGADGIFIENPATGRIAPIPGNYRDALFSPQENFLGLVAKTGIISRLFLKNEKYQPFRPRDSFEVSVTPPEPATQLLWFGKDESHFIFSAKSGLYFAEADSRFGSNIFKISATTSLIAALPGATNRFLATDGSAVEVFEIPE